MSAVLALTAASVAPASAADKVIIGFSQASSNSAHRNTMTSRNKEYAEANLPDAELIITNAEGKADKQISDVESLLVQGINVLMISAQDSQALTPVVKEKLQPSAKKDVKGEALTWKDVVLRSKDFPEELNIDGSNFVRVDHLQLVNDDSEKAHKFRIEGQKDMWKSRQTFTYPDKESVSDSGVAYIGGEAKWQVQNLKPGKDLIVIKRFDAILGEQICDISVDGKKVGQWKVTEADRKHRWRNHYFLVPGTFVTNDTLEMSAKAVSAERDINMFQLWFYQPA